MADVSAAKDSIRAAGAEIAIVHGATPLEAAQWFTKFALDDVVKISDPDLAHYRAFGLGRTTAGALVDPNVWTRGAACALSYGFGGQTPAMMRQLPGVFLVQGERLIAAYRHETPADRPDYLALARYADPALQ